MNIAPLNFNMAITPQAPCAPARPATLATPSAPSAPQDSWSQETTPRPDFVEFNSLLALNTPQASQATPEIATSALSAPTETPQEPENIAQVCNDMARSDAPIEERVEFITAKLAEGVQQAESPDPSWEKATPEQLRLYVHETLEHIDSLRAIGDLRGMDFSNHDLEAGNGKFEPRVAQFLALPGRSDSVKWSIAEHNQVGHHDTWKDPQATREELAESASDIVNAWRMQRRVYDKPSWSWERITSVIEDQFQNNQINTAQRDALYEAIPYQMEYEASLER